MHYTSAVVYEALAFNVAVDNGVTFATVVDPDDHRVYAVACNRPAVTEDLVPWNGAHTYEYLTEVSVTAHHSKREAEESAAEARVGMYVEGSEYWGKYSKPTREHRPRGYREAATMLEEAFKEVAHRKEVADRRRRRT